MDNMIGKLLDNRYEILDIIGQGGMAMVYRATDRRLNRAVAVKILRSDLAGDEEFRRRFRDEAQAVAMLAHPNIVSVYDVSRGETEYIVMELIDGITLKQYMQRRGKLNWREALHFIIEIMRGLQHAHSRGIIHRDIKPQNVMVLRDGSVKIADFGIALLGSAAQPTMTQEALGSVHYISPEQAKGERTDARSDIYSAGVVLYEMLTNRLPFEGDNAVSVAIQHLNSVPLSPCEIDPTVPSALEKICMKAMAGELGRRYASADEMLADLLEFRKNPDTTLGFTIEDLRDDNTDEPTQHVPVSRIKSNVPPRPVREREAEEDHEQESGKTTLTKGLIAAAIVLVCAVALIGLWRFVLRSFHNVEPVQTEFVVPYLVGKSVEEAEADEEIGGVFTIVVVGQRASADYAAGQIIEQTPAAGRTVRENREISVFVSTGIKSDTMPNVINQEHRAAKIILRELGLNLEVNVSSEEYSDTVPAGYVIRSNPAAGETIQDGDTVILVLSKGVKTLTATVTKLTEIPLEQAQTIVSNLGLVCLIEYAHDDVVPTDFVISQSIPADTTVEQGSSIKLIVSLGPEVVEVIEEPLAEPTTDETEEPTTESPADNAEVTELPEATEESETTEAQT
ncbi:MAG: Stk1 family PASTA domain-containing Ser/Thr kinase [Oscillospiraceae bacterium]|nr:Stk1 family PASTA domain-containing Ser/Thr kinase [Oscillospiraceae bacterium]